jgi:DNA-binding NtrC family response regulator
LEGLTNDGKFREDLLDRLNVDLITTPPLRLRIEDIPELSRHFISVFTRESNRSVRGVSAAVLDFFCRYTWPGNARQLRSVLQRAVIYAQGPVIQMDDLSFEFLQKPLVANIKAGKYHDAMREASRQFCLQALECTNGNHRDAAELLQLNRTYFYQIIRAHNLVMSECQKGSGSRP